MEFPLHVGIGDFKVNAHLIFELLAFSTGFQYFMRIRKKKPDLISDTNRTWIMIGAIFGALVGSRLIGSLENPIAFFDSQTSFLYYYANKTIVGGLLGGLVGVEGMKKLIKVKTSSGDLFTFPLILGMMIGRVGCFTSGIYEATYGIESNLPWAMDLGDGLKRHPVALYEIAFLAILWIGLRYVESIKTLANGRRFQLFLFSYLVFRFLLDCIKPAYRFPFHLTTIQITCLLGMIYYLRLFNGHKQAID